MAKEAKLKVSLDLTGARSELASLYKEMGNAPGVTPRSVPGGGPGGVPTPGAAGFLGMGFGRLAGLGLGLGVIGTLGRDSLRDAGTLGAGITGGPSESIRRFLFGDTAAVTRGQNAALEQVKEQLGLAVGLQGATQGERERIAERYMGVFDTISRITVATEQGKQAFDTVVKPRISDDALGGIFGRLTETLDRLTRVLDRTPGGA